MKGSNLGEFEELVLLTILALGEKAYSKTISDHLKDNSFRNCMPGVVHAVLKRLEDKELIESSLSTVIQNRGGKRKRFYVLTQSGKSSIDKSKQLRDSLWNLVNTTL